MPDPGEPLEVRRVETPRRSGLSIASITSEEGRSILGVPLTARLRVGGLEDRVQGPGRDLAGAVVIDPDEPGPTLLAVVADRPLLADQLEPAGILKQPVPVRCPARQTRAPAACRSGSSGSAETDGEPEKEFRPLSGFWPLSGLSVLFASSSTGGNLGSTFVLDVLPKLHNISMVPLFCLGVERIDIAAKIIGCATVTQVHRFDIALDWFVQIHW